MIPEPISILRVISFYLFSTSPASLRGKADDERNRVRIDEVEHELNVCQFEQQGKTELRV